MAIRISHERLVTELDLILVSVLSGSAGENVQDNGKRYTSWIVMEKMKLRLRTPGDRCIRESESSECDLIRKSRRPGACDESKREAVRR